HQYRPFCSARCRDVDLARWFNEAYMVPAAAPGDGDEDEGEGEEKS
ncbi:MAG: DNA gyrase inhibitor YacG, partial [Geminicoccales bacterium]